MVPVAVSINTESKNHGLMNIKLFGEHFGSANLYFPKFRSKIKIIPEMEFLYQSYSKTIRNMNIRLFGENFGSAILDFPK